MTLRPLIPYGIWKCWFCGGRKTGESGEKPSEQGREPTTNSTHIRHRDRESNPGHMGGRRALSPLCHPCSPNMLHRSHPLNKEPARLMKTVISCGEYITISFSNCLQRKQFLLLIEGDMQFIHTILSTSQTSTAQQMCTGLLDVQEKKPEVAI